MKQSSATASVIGESSNGRTTDSDSVSLGSNPSSPANLFNDLAGYSSLVEYSLREFCGTPVDKSPQNHQFRLPAILITNPIRRLDEPAEFSSRVMGRDLA